MGHVEISGVLGAHFTHVKLCKSLTGLSSIENQENNLMIEGNITEEKEGDN